MKKITLILVLLLCVSICFSMVPSFKKTIDNDTLTSFSFPTSLVKIEEEAFAETAVTVAVLPDSVWFIGERAFADSKLQMIQVPESVIYIGDHAFGEVSNLTICGTEDSYAARWAKEHDISFVEENSVAAIFEKLKKMAFENLLFALISCCIPVKSAFSGSRRIEKYKRSMRPQDRIELYPINYRFP